MLTGLERPPLSPDTNLSHLATVVFSSDEGAGAYFSAHFRRVPFSSSYRSVHTGSGYNTVAQWREDT